MVGIDPLAWWVGKDEGLMLELGCMYWQVEHDWVMFLRYWRSLGDRERDCLRKVCRACKFGRKSMCRYEKNVFISAGEGKV
jgi:hypothetical protein